jgi:hypothetical protein
LYVDGLIDRSDILALFESAKDESAVSSTELLDFQLIVDNSSLFGGAEHVWKLTSYIVSGNTANANYQGQTLGNLAAGSTDAHLGQLVNKWFSGLDRPVAPSGYALASGSLFINGPSYADINQGGVADCAFLASLAETALRAPNQILNMFVVNGDGTYTVRFYRSGVTEYVTVDSYLPTSGVAGTPNGELWGALAEKAYAQFFEILGEVNAYSSIDFQYAYSTLAHITGQNTAAFAYTSSSTSLTTFANAWSIGEMICLISYSSGTSSGIVANHAYAVVGYDAASSTVTLFNPWGINYGLTTLTWSQVQANFKYFDRTV